MNSYLPPRYAPLVGWCRLTNLPQVARLCLTVLVIMILVRSSGFAAGKDMMIPDAGTYHYKSDGDAQLMGLDPSRMHYGFMAQELKEVFPTLVQEKSWAESTEKGVGKTGTFLAVNYIEMIPILTQALKESMQKTDELETRLQRLEKAAGVTTTTNTIKELIGGLELGDAIPNPASTTAIISYKLPEEVPALLTIVSLEGKVIKEIALVAAETSYNLDVTALGSGMYIYNLSASGYKSVTKTLIVR